MKSSGRQAQTTSPAGAINPRTWRWFAIAIILLGAALRLYQLGQDSLWLDEIITQQMTQRTVPKMLKLVGTYSAHPPLFYLLAYQNRVLGFSDFAARLTSVAAGILTIPVLIVLARKLWGAPVGLMAGLLLALWPTHLHFSQEARQYALLMLFASLSMYWLYRGVRGGGIGAWIGYVIASTGALYSHNFAFLWVAGQVVFVGVMWLLSWRSQGVAGLKTYGRGVILPLVLALFFTGLFYLPWAPSLLTQSKRLIGGVSLPSAKDAGGPSYAEILKQSLRFFAEKNAPFKTIFIALALVGFVVGALQRRWAALIFITSSLVIPFLIMGMITSSHFFTARYLFPLLTPIILLCAEAFRPLFRLDERVFERSSRARLFGVIAIFLVVVVLALIPIQDYYQREKEDWHGVARLLMARKAPNDLILADGTLIGKAGDASRVQQALGYYLPDETILEAAPTSVQTLLDHPDPEATVWGVLWHQRRLGARDQISPDIEITDFHFLTVLQMKEPSGDLLQDTAAMLEAMLLLQRQTESHPDLHLTLAEIYLELRDPQKAAEHTAAAMQTLNPANPRLLTALLHVLESPQIQKRLAAFDFIAQAGTAALDAPESDFPLFEQAAFTINGSERDVLMLRPPASLSYTIHVPADATFLTTSLATDPETWDGGGDGVTFQLDVIASGEADRLLDQHIGAGKADRRWRDVLIDMRPYRDRDVTLTFRVHSGPYGDFSGEWAGWAKPILWRESPRAPTSS